jgi:hypothetical protein
MKHVVRVELVETRPSGRKNGRNVEQILDCFEVDCDDMADGQQLMEDLSAYVEEIGGELAEDD